MMGVELVALLLFVPALALADGCKPVDTSKCTSSTPQYDFLALVRQRRSEDRACGPIGFLSLVWATWFYVMFSNKYVEECCSFASFPWSSWPSELWSTTRAWRRCHNIRPQIAPKALE